MNIKDDILEIKENVKEIIQSLKNVDITVAKQEVSLKEHIRRTNILEQKLEPVEKHVAMVNGVLKFIGFISVVVGIIAAIREIVK